MLAADLGDLETGVGFLEDRDDLNGVGPEFQAVVYSCSILGLVQLVSGNLITQDYGLLIVVSEGLENIVAKNKISN